MSTGRQGADDLHRWVEVCAAAGAGGLLLDTCRKDGPGLFGFVGVQALASLRRHATRHGTWLAVAGGVADRNLEQLAQVRPHVVGVRGAVCEGGRAGTLSLERVRLLHEALADITAAYTASSDAGVAIDTLSSGGQAAVEPPVDQLFQWSVVSA